MTEVMLPYVGNQDITVPRPDASFDSSEISYSKLVGARHDIPVIVKRAIQALPKVFGMPADMHCPFHSGVK